MKYSHIVFDIDNTLTDTTAAVLNSLQKALLEVTGEHRDVSKLTPVLGIPGLKAFEVLGIQSPEVIFKLYPLWEQYMNEYQHTAYVYDGIRSLLDELKTEGYKLGIITSKTEEQYRTTFLPFGIADYFDCVVTADDTLHHKPGPEPMNAYLWMNDVPPSRVLYVGDSIYDMQCASAAGTDSALALWGCHNPDGISSTYRFATPSGLMKWLKDGCPDLVKTE